MPTLLPHHHPGVLWDWEVGLHPRLRGESCCEKGALAPPKRMRGEEDGAGDAQHCPTTAGMRHMWGRSEGGKLILKFPSCEIEAHVPIMKYFLPFHGSSVIPDGREPGKTDPPCSHPRRLTARAGTNKGFVLPGRGSSPPPAWTPYSILQTRPYGEPFAPFPPPPAKANPYFQGYFGAGLAAAWHPPPRHHPGSPWIPGARQAAPGNSRCFHLLLDYVVFPAPLNLIKL